MENNTYHRHGLETVGHPSLKMPPLEPVDWKKVGASAPKAIPLDGWDSLTSTLPAKVDHVVITWTEAEWNALDFVFCNSDKEMPYYRGSHKNEWKNKWYKCSKGYAEAKKEYDIPSYAPSVAEDAWGSIFLVEVNGKKVLLVKSEMHISTDGVDMPVTAFVEKIIKESSPSVFFTIGTAGGAKVNSKLGDVSVTNAGKFELTGKFKDKKFANSTFSNHWQPKDGIQSLITPLMREVPATDEMMNILIDELNDEEGTKLTWKDLGNDDINPEKLADPKAEFWNHDPVLTTNGYEIATTDGNYKQYVAMDMDDAAVAMVCDKYKTSFGSFRNISDPVINANIPCSKPTHTIQKGWSAKIYSTFGFYSSYNGAIAAWAAIAE